ncbi:MAG TPA: methyltransferase domain-containing protein [Flavobacteriaceae bacterium]
MKLVTDNITTALQQPENAKYDFRAPYYEWMVKSNWFNLLHWNTAPKHYTEFAKDAIINQSGKLIDVGCGGLAQTYSLYQKTENECTLIDRSIGMLKMARKRLINTNHNIPPNIVLLQGDAFNLPFSDNSFDILCSFGTIHLFDNKKMFIERILKVLKPKGHFYFLVMTSKYPNSRLFMNLLRQFGEFGKVCSESELLALFPTDKYIIDSYMKGSVLFIKGQKL